MNTVLLSHHIVCLCIVQLTSPGSSTDLRTVVAEEKGREEMQARQYTAAAVQPTFFKALSEKGHERKGAAARARRGH